MLPIGTASGVSATFRPICRDRTSYAPRVYGRTLLRPADSAQGTTSPFPSIDPNGAWKPAGRGTFAVRTAGESPLSLAATLRTAVCAGPPGFRVTGRPHPAGAQPNGYPSESGSWLCRTHSSRSGTGCLRALGPMAYSTIQPVTAPGDWYPDSDRSAVCRHCAARRRRKMRDGDARRGHRFLPVLALASLTGHSSGGDPGGTDRPGRNAAH